MIIKKAVYAQGNVDYKKCPNPDRPEYAMLGRSNVGKSSLINMLTDHGKLAQVSSNPGKTKLINHFNINDVWYLVDLPGYGWARASKTSKTDWNKMTKDYLIHRENLICAFVLIDSCIDAQKVDLEFMQWLATSQVPFVIVFTKADRNKKMRNSQLLENYKKVMLETWEELPQMFITSSKDKMGKEEILSFIDGLNHDYIANQ